MQENPLVPSEQDSDEEVADMLEQRYLPKTPSTLSSQTEKGSLEDTPMKTRAATAKRPANYPIQEPPLTRRRGNPTRSHTELVSKLEQCTEDHKAILANQELIKANQERVLERLERMTKMIMDCQTRMSVAEARIQGMQESRKEVAGGPTTSTQERGTEPTVTPHATVGRGSGTAPSRGAGAFF